MGKRKPQYGSPSSIDTLQVSERHLDIIIDRLNDLNDETPRIHCSGKKGVPPSLIFGLDSKLYLEGFTNQGQSDHNEEVETATISRGIMIHTHDHHDHGHSDPHPEESSNSRPLRREDLEKALDGLSKEFVWRVKGFVQFADDLQRYILNWAFCRHDLTMYSGDVTGFKDSGGFLLTIMGAQGEMRPHARKLAATLGATLS